MIRKKIPRTVIGFLFLSSGYAVIFDAPIYRLDMLSIAIISLFAFGTLSVIWNTE